MKIWSCKIGEIRSHKCDGGPDMPMREAIEKAYEEVTGEKPDFIFSGWWAELTDEERAVVEDRASIHDLGSEQTIKISMRDWFAGVLMNGMLSSDSHPDIDLLSLMGNEQQIEKRALFAYRLADAMIRARSI